MPSAWRDNMQQASFRDVPFIVQEHDGQGGRRVGSHEFAGRDVPFTEDMGRKQRKHTLQALVIGADYHLARDRLIDALEQPGAGLLVHPWLGQMWVRIDQYTVSESTARGGMASFSIQAVESGEPIAPRASVATDEAVEATADNVQLVAMTEFEGTFSVAGMAVAALDRLLNDVTHLEQKVGAATGELTRLARAPGQLAQQLVNSVANMVVLAQSTQAALKHLSITPVWPLAANTKILRMAQNQHALEQLQNVAVLTTLATQVAAGGIRFDNQQQAASFLQQFCNAADEFMSSEQPSTISAGRQAIDDALYSALSDLKAVLNVHLRQTSLQLPRIHKLTLNQTTPGLVVVYNHYESLAPEADFIARNGIKHPAFVPASRALEVLTRERDPHT